MSRQSEIRNQKIVKLKIEIARSLQYQIKESKKSGKLGIGIRKVENDKSQASESYRDVEIYLDNFRLGNSM